MRAVPFRGFGVDLMTPCSAQGYRDLYQAGARFVGHYLGHVTLANLNDLFAAGLLFWPIGGFARESGWSAATGLADAQETIAAATSLGLPSGISITLDLEGAGMTAEDAIAYATANANAIDSTGDIPMIYAGAGCPLNGQQLYDLPHRGYVQAFTPGYVPECGFQIIQGSGDVSFAGMTVDLDMARADYLGRLPVLVGAD